MIEIKNKADCCGCNACADICGKNAITFKTDSEGFWYPEVDREKCVDCGLCEKVCPVINAEELKKNDYKDPKCVAAIHKNLEVRFDSTSGGMFSALAEKMYKEGGYVGGAVYTEEWGVKFFISNNPEDLPKLRSSKYLQSNSEGMYLQIRSLLKEGKKVLVCGLPCQIAALKAFLRKDYENLITVDLICRYINSPFAYRRYLDSLEAEFGGKVVYIKAKSKELGWRKLTHKVLFSNNRTYYGTRYDDIFMKASMTLNCLSRPSCYECAFKGFPRYADITIGDFWTDKNTSKLDDDTGTSIVLLNSQKGEEYFQNIKSIKKEPVSLNKVLEGNFALVKSLPAPSVNRDVFFERIAKEDFSDVVNSMVDTIENNFKFKTIKKLRKVKNIIRCYYRQLRVSHFRIVPFVKFLYYNLIHPAVKSKFSERKALLICSHCDLEINRKAKIELGGLLTIGESVFKNSKLETRLKIEKNGQLITHGDYGFGYGSNIEIFENAILISKGGPRTNMGTTIICQDKIVIGKEVAIGRDVTIRDNNGGHQISINGYLDKMPIIIGDHCWLTQNVIIMSGVKIGDGTIISAGTLVNSSFPARCVVGGSPARVTKRDIYWKM